MIQVQIPRHGAPEVLQIIERPDPVPGQDEVRIAVRAAGLNFADVLARMGLYQDAPPPPMVMGYEVAGEVAAVGPGVTTRRVGERVLALTRFGGHSSAVIVPATQAVPLPEAMTFEEGAALPVAYLTAYHMLYRLGNLQPGERVLVHSAGGAVGIAAIQLARARQAVILGTASQGKHSRLYDLGVNHCIDYTREDFVESVRQITGGQGVHVILDAIGGESFRKSYRCLAKTGRLFCFGISSFAPGTHRRWLPAIKELVWMPWFHPVSLMTGNKGVFGVNLGALWDVPEVMHGELRELLDLFAQGVVKPIVDRTFPAQQAAEAHRYIQARKNFGKVLLAF
jgi:synaptic vesicle membrane protein VAT-1